MFYFGIVLVTLIGYIAWFYLVKDKREPNEGPGPIPVPLIGNLHHIVKENKVIFLALHKLAMKYGPVTTIWLGHKKYCIVSGFEELKAIMHNPVFDDRRSPFKKELIDEIYTGQTKQENPRLPGILFGSGDRWHELRRFSLRSLRDHGFGKQIAESLIVEEAAFMIEHIEEKIEGNNGVIGDFDDIFAMMSLNVVWQIIAGERFNYENAGMVRLLNYIQNINTVFWDIQFGPLPLLPFLRYLPPFKQKVKSAQAKMDSLLQFFEMTVNQHQETLDKNNIRDYIDAYLIDQKSTTPDNIHELVIIMTDLFLAGSETTSKSMEWTCLYMILHPEVQKKVQKELDLVIEDGKMVQSYHRSKLTYTDATLHEVFRLGPIGPIAATRGCSRDFDLGPYKIKAGTTIFPNLYSITMDEQHWGPNVKDFCPDRFINKMDGTFQKDDWLLTFGTGRRKCLGESVARVETFLIFANLLKHFSLERLPGQDLTTDPRDGMAIGPHHFKLLASKRF